MKKPKDSDYEFPIKRWLLGFVALAFVLMFLFPPPAAEPQVKFSGDEQFRTTAPSRIYFKNMRQVNYYKEPVKGNDSDLFRFRKFRVNDDVPLLYPVIVNNWMSSEAYIFIQRNDYPYFPEDLHIRWRTDSSQGNYHLGTPSRPAQYEFAGKIYNSLKKQHRLSIQTSKDSSYVPIFEEAQDRQHFMQVLRDYYELTEAQRTAKRQQGS